jgi:hypothetical protein
LFEKVESAFDDVAALVEFGVATDRSSITLGQEPEIELELV